MSRIELIKFAVQKWCLSELHHSYYKLRHVTRKRFCIENRMLCSILFSIVSTEIGKKVRFRHNKDNFCSSFFIVPTNLAKNGYFSENKKPLYSHFSGKTKSFT